MILRNSHIIARHRGATPSPVSAAQHTRLPAFALLTIIALTAISACEHADLADEAMATRVGQLEQTAQIWGNVERTRPQRLGRMLEHAAWYLEHQADELNANTAHAQSLVERELERASVRLPAYSQRALEILYGKPERIEENAIILFY